MRPDIYEFEVEGSGRFPFDMLRYDTCWPAREAEDSYELANDREFRKIRLRGLRPPTIARWHSFDWGVVEHSDRGIARYSRKL